MRVKKIMELVINYFLIFVLSKFLALTMLVPILDVAVYSYFGKLQLFYNNNYSRVESENMSGDKTPPDYVG